MNISSVLPAALAGMLLFAASTPSGLGIESGNGADPGQGLADCTQG